MVSLLYPRRSLITFDLGAAGIRAYQFQQRGRHPRLCDALRLDRSAPARPPPLAHAEQVGDQRSEGEQPGTTKQHDSASSELVDPEQVERLVGQGRFAGRSIGLILSPPDVSFFPMRLPDHVLTQPPDRFAQALLWEVARESRESPDQIEVRYWVLPSGRTQQANVMAVVMSSGLARRWCDLFDRHRLTLQRLDASPCALVRMGRCAWAPSDDELWGVLDLGLRHSTMTVVVGCVPTYIRSLSVRTHDWTEQLARGLEIPYAAAEELKREHGVRQTLRGVTPSVAGRNPLQATDLPSACSSILRGSLRALMQEVGRCFSYVMQGFPEHTVKGLLLAGGGAEMRGLPQALEAELEIPVALLRSGEESLEWPEALADAAVDPSSAAALGGALLALETS